MRIVVFIFPNIMYLKIESVSNDARFPLQSSNRKTSTGQNTLFQVSQTQDSSILQILVFIDLSVQGTGKTRCLNFGLLT